MRPLRLMVQDKWGDVGCIFFHTPLEGYEMIKVLKNSQGNVIVLEWACKILAPGDESAVVVTDPNRVGVSFDPLTVATHQQLTMSAGLQRSPAQIFRSSLGSRLCWRV